MVQTRGWTTLTAITHCKALARLPASRLAAEQVTNVRENACPLACCSCVFVLARLLLLFKPHLDGGLESLNLNGCNATDAMHGCQWAGNECNQANACIVCGMGHNLDRERLDGALELRDSPA